MANITTSRLLLTRSTGTSVNAITLQQLLATPQPQVAAVRLTEAPFPIVPDDHIEPGKLYEATDGGAQFAVPAYALEVVDGRYTSSLRWRRPDDDPNGPIAFLTLKFSVDLPPGSREIAHQATVRLAHRVAVSDSPDHSASLSTELGALVRTSTTTAELRYSMMAKDEFDALWLAITDPDRPATVNLSATVTIQRRAWRPPWRPIVTGAGWNLHSDWKLGPRIDVEQPQVSSLAGEVVQPERGLPLDPDFTHLRRRNDDGPIIDIPDLTHLRRRNDDGPIIDIPFRPVHPPRDPEPVLVELSLPFAATVGPFAFPVETNAYMFDVPGDLRPQTTRLLLRHEFDPGSDRPRLVYYEDTAFSNRYYYEPQQFRVPRDETDPYLPRLAIAFVDVSVTDENGTPTVHYTARLGYSAIPDLDGFVLTALQRELAAQHGSTELDLTALLPQQATLSLQLPDDAAGGRLTTVTHTLPSEAFDDGFSDEIELSVSEFAIAIALLQSDALRGIIVADLLGAGHTEIPVELSLRDTPAVPLHRVYRGPVGNGLVRVSVMNPLESPVQIIEMYGVSPAAGVSAFPQSDPGLRIPPAGSIDLDYRLTPDGSMVDDLAPALRAVVHADLRVLLPKIMVNSGYSDQTFALTVRTDPALLAAATAQGALIGLLVQFECDVEVLLDATAPSHDTAIRMPILPWLLKDADAQRYRYRVVNLHGTAEAPEQGEVGEWVDGLGGGVLAVAPTSG